MKKIILSPSLICADLLDLRNQINLLASYGFNFLHLDIMDLHFVPNLTLGFDLVNQLSEFKIQKNVHLMVDRIEDAIARLKINKDDFITFHLEAESDHLKLINQIKSQAKAGLAINPETPIEKIFPYLDKIDLVLLMSVKPGFSGQPFIPQTYERIKQLVNQVQKVPNNPLLSVDGGVGQEEILNLQKSGVDICVLGNALFNGDFKTNLKNFSHLNSII